MSFIPTNKDSFYWQHDWVKFWRDLGKSLTTIPDRLHLMTIHQGLFSFTDEFNWSDAVTWCVSVGEATTNARFNEIQHNSSLLGFIFIIIDIVNGNKIESSKSINIIQGPQNFLITIPGRSPLMTNLQISKKRMVGVISSIFLLSLAILATAQGRSQLAFAQGMNYYISENNSIMTMSSSSSSLPQPNANGTLLKVETKNALFEPAAGLSNVFGPEGLFPFANVFKCANALTYGVSGGDDAKFTATFEEGNKNNMTSYEATYTSTVTYGPHQIKGHT